MQLNLIFSAVLLLVCSTAQAEIEMNSNNVTDTSPNPAHDFRDGKCKFQLNIFPFYCDCKQQFGFWTRTVFGLFDMVVYNNQACRALSGDIGTCLSFPECFAFRGTVSGSCGKGFGLCCVSKSFVFDWLIIVLKSKFNNDTISFSVSQQDVFGSYLQ